MTMKIVTATKVDLNLLVASNALLLGLQNPATLSVDVGTLLINGVPAGQSATVQPSDTVQVQLTSPNSYLTTEFSVLSVDSVATLIFALTTQSKTEVVPNPYYKDVLPLDITSNPDQSFYAQTFEGSTIQCFTSSGKTDIDATSLIVNQGPNNLDEIVVANYLDKSVSYVDPTSKIIRNKVALVGTPYGVAYTSDQVTGKTLTWVTLSDKDEVVCIDPASLTVINTHLVGHRPLGLAASAAGDLWTANYEGNTVTRIKSDGTILDIAVGNGPFEIALDSLGNAFVTNNLDGTVSRVNASTNSVDFTIPVGSNPWGIAIIGGFAYVANSYDGTISKIDVLTKAVVKTIACGNIPYSIAQFGTGFSVSCYGDVAIQNYENDLLVSIVRTNNYPFGLSIDTLGQLWSASYYPSTPSRVLTTDQTVNPFEFIACLNLSKDTPSISNSITISGLSDGVTVPAAIPAFHNALLLKNGVLIGTSTTVQNGDTLAIKVPALSTYGLDISIPLAIGDVTSSWHVTTAIQDQIVDQFSFNDVVGVSYGISLTSNAIQITGISPDAQVSISTSNGTIVKNGLDTGLAYALVGLDDTIAIKLMAPSTPCSTAYATVRSGPITDTWSVTTTKAAGIFVLPDYELSGPYGIPFTADNSTNELMLVDHSLEAVSGAFPLRDLGVVDSTQHEYLYTTDFKSDKVWVTNLLGQVVKEINLPAGAAPYSAILVEASAGKLLAVSMSGLNGVAFLDPASDYSIKQVLATRNTPMGMCLDADGSLWVVCNTEDIAQKIVISPQGFVVNSTFSTGKLPLEIVFYSGSVYITNSGVSTVTVIDGLGNKSQIQVGNNPWGLVVSGTDLYVSNSFDNTVSKINLTTDATSTISVGAIPYKMGIATSGDVWVSHLGDSSLYLLDKDTNVVTKHLVLDSVPCTINTDSTGNLWVGCLYSNMPSRAVELNSWSSDFGSVSGQLLSKSVESVTKTVSGLVRPIVASVENIPGNSILKNGVDCGYSTILSNGDSVSLKTNTSDQYDTVSTVSLTTCGSTSTFSTRTQVDSFPDVIVFNPIVDTAPYSSVQSNTGEITGLGANVSVTAEFSTGTITLNGTDTGVSSCIVKNGDTIELVIPEVHVPYGYTYVYPVLIGGTAMSWSVTSRPLSGSEIAIPVETRDFLLANWVGSTSNNKRVLKFSQNFAISLSKTKPVPLKQDIQPVKVMGKALSFDAGLGVRRSYTDTKSFALGVFELSKSKRSEIGVNHMPVKSKSLALAFDLKRNLVKQSSNPIRSEITASWDTFKALNTTSIGLEGRERFSSTSTKEFALASGGPLVSRVKSVTFSNTLSIAPKPKLSAFPTKASLLQRQIFWKTVDSPLNLGWYATEQDALQACLNEGYMSEECIAREAMPGAWIWQTPSCRTQLIPRRSAILGYIHGG